MKPETVTITEFTIKDLGGVHHMHARCGQITLIIGANEAGKTTCLNALRNIFEGGGDPLMVREGCEAGTVEMTLSNGYRAVKTLTRSGYDLEVFNPDGGPIKAPKRWLDDLAPALSFDPIKFLELGPREQSDFLLATLPLKFEAAEVNGALNPIQDKLPVVAMTSRAALELAAERLPEAPRLEVHGEVTLQRLLQLRDEKFAERTLLNSKWRDLEGTIATLSRGLPADMETDWRVERARLAAEHLRLTGSRLTIETAIKSAALLERDAALTDSNGVIQTLETDWQEADHDFEKRIRALEAQRLTRRNDYQAARSKVESERADLNSRSHADAARKVQADTADIAAELVTVSSDLAAAEVHVEEQQRAAGVMVAIEKERLACSGFIAREAILSEVITGLDRLKNSRLETIPIPGLDLAWDKNRPIIRIDGIQIDRLNRQRQIFTAIQLVKLAMGDLPLILCEVAELDDDKLEVLTSAAKEAGIQMLLARWVRGAPLTAIEALP